jgi:Ca2+/Na+ antiporter
MGAAALFVGLVLSDGRSRRWEGLLLIGVYAAFAALCFHLGDR